MRFFFLIPLCLLAAYTSVGQAQTAPERKAQELIDALNQTPFVRQYREYKAGIELDVAEFRLSESDYPEREVKRVQLYYDQSRQQFDALLDKLEADLANRAMRKTIAQNPQRYSKSLQGQLTAAVNYYNDNCKKLMEQLSERDSAMDLDAVQGLFDSVMGLVELFKSKGESANQITAAYLESEFIQPLRLKRWEEM
jgi:hypothetical protein